MSWFSDVFGGGSKTSKSTSQAITRTQDQRIGIEGGLGGGVLVGPESAFAMPGSVVTRAGDFSSITTNLAGSKFRVGMTGAEVKELLQQQGSLASEQLARVGDFAQASLSAATAARTGEATDLTRYIPYAVIGIVVLAVIKSRRS